MPRNKTETEKAAGKLISAIQKVWGDQAGIPEAMESEDIMGRAHELLQARNSEGMKRVLGHLSVGQFLGEIWLQKHPTVKLYVKTLAEAINANA